MKVKKVILMSDERKEWSHIVNNNNKLVLTEYNNFKNTYINLLSVSSGQEITINERYEDPPFNTIAITREDMILQKGSLLEWIKEYHG